VTICQSGLAGASDTPRTLDDLIAQAVRDNPSLLAARKQMEAAAGRAQQSRRWPNPELELSAEDIPADDVDLSESKNMVGLSQTVPFPGKKRLDGRAGRQEVVATEWEYRARERELIRDVTLAYFGVLAGEKKVAVAAELVTLAQSLADAARKRVAAGAAADQEQLRAEIEVERANIEATAARREVAGAQRTLSRLLGRPNGELGPVRGELREVVPVRVRPVGHPQLAAATAQRERAELELRRARIEPLPDVTLSAAYGRDESLNENQLEFRVSLPLPLFDRAQGRKREARALADIARYDLAATEQRLAQEWDVAVARLQAAQSQVDAYRTRILPKAEQALKLVRGGFEAGKFGFLDLVDTQRTTIEVRLAYYDKLLELNAAAAELDALAGSSPQKENQP
jgi:cobalt-zinc-cadmium efflux system outer membrane protein